MKRPLRNRSPLRGPVRSSVLQGLLLIARGRPEGLQCFAATPDGFLSALAPWLAFLLVGLLLMLLRQPTVSGITLILLSFCALLLPSVLSHALAAAWTRRPFWLRYATAVIWCEWLVIVAYAVSLMLVTALLQLGVPADVAGLVFLALVALYWLWLHWFLAWRGLALGAGRAALLVLAVVVATGVLCALVQLLPPHVGLFTMPGGGSIRLSALPGAGQVT
ncbi:hypothetical protein [Lichenicoccus roseus]|uniref:Yip1 domain-containing protein n=1 Tax=Lichenicoccus roseus TaxID=2683649 RepID=A0A5R9J8D4_9PROT|nr:hypothetical protein [Lichenicoccus roseus]TLU73842.1 hypothetical protein FE263_00980 [Lichenicoccus roseus]